MHRLYFLNQLVWFIYGYSLVLGYESELGVSTVEWYFGASFAYLKHNVHNFYTCQDTAADPFLCQGGGFPFTEYDDYHYNSTFKGAGPIVGADILYPVFASQKYGKWDVIGGLSLALLVGRIDTVTDVDSLKYYPNPAPIDRQMDKETVTRVVTNINGDVGIGFEDEIWNEHTLRIEGGYMAKVYLDSVDTIYINEDPTTNLSFAGPFLRFSVSL